MSGTVVWITGLPASGKTTLAERTRAGLAVPSAILDGDAFREILGEERYSAAERDAFYRRLARLAALLAGQDLVVLVPATANLRRYRDEARALAPRFLEVWVKTPLDEAMRRDRKGLYERARRGEAPDLPGAGAPYEPPESPEVVAGGGLDAGAAEAIVRRVSRKH